MFIPQEHLRESLLAEDYLTNEEEPFVVELWQDGNYNEYGGDVGDVEVYPW